MLARISALFVAQCSILAISTLRGLPMTETSPAASLLRCRVANGGIRNREHVKSKACAALLQLRLQLHALNLAGRWPAGQRRIAIGTSSSGWTSRANSQYAAQSRRHTTEQ